jgi:hypothetical protein
LHRQNSVDPLVSVPAKFLSVFESTGIFKPTEQRAFKQDYTPTPIKNHKATSNVWHHFVEASL